MAPQGREEREVMGVSGEYATVSVGPDGVSVTIAKPNLMGGPTTDVAAFSWVERVDVQRWAEDYAAAINRAVIAREASS